MVDKVDIKEEEAFLNVTLIPSTALLESPRAYLGMRAKTGSFFFFSDMAVMYDVCRLGRWSWFAGQRKTLYLVQGPAYSLFSFKKKKKMFMFVACIAYSHVRRTTALYFLHVFGLHGFV